METTLKRERNIGADVIRCLAFFTVVSVHFFLNSGYYYVPVVGEKMLVLTIMRSFFIICVPLFMMLSGYLMRKKALSKKYYGKFGKTYLTYVLASVFCIAYAVLFRDKEFSLTDSIFSIFNFSGAPYSWYVEMYLGLFLIIPFLNLLFNNIPSKKWKLALLIIFTTLTALPAVINVYNLTSGFEWWLHPTLSGEYHKIIPSYWVELYPLTYYFIGCYIGEFGIKMKSWVNFLLIVATTLLAGGYCYWRSYGANFIWGDWCIYYSAFNVVLTTLVFAFFINLDYSKTPKWIAWIFKKASPLCFAGYLLSWIFDDIFYPILNTKVPDVTNRLFGFIIIVPAVYVCSLLPSFVLCKLQEGIEKLFGLLFSKKNKAAEATPEA